MDGFTGKIYTWTKVQNTKHRQYSCCSSIRERERICFWGLSTGRKMFSESKLGPLLSFSWPLLKLKPQISPGCYGLHGLLITLVGASLWREGKGWGLREVWGTTQAEMSPSCQLFGCKGKQAGALYSRRKSWCVTITDSRFVISWTCLELTHRVAHGSLCRPGRNKARLLSGWTESQEKTH